MKINLVITLPIKGSAGDIILLRTNPPRYKHDVLTKATLVYHTKSILKYSQTKANAQILKGHLFVHLTNCIHIFSFSKPQLVKQTCWIGNEEKKVWRRPFNVQVYEQVVDDVLLCIPLAPGTQMLFGQMQTKHTQKIRIYP